MGIRVLSQRYCIQLVLSLQRKRSITSLLIYHPLSLILFPFFPIVCNFELKHSTYWKSGVEIHFKIYREKYSVNIFLTKKTASQLQVHEHVSLCTCIFVYASNNPTASSRLIAVHAPLKLCNKILCVKASSCMMDWRWYSTLQKNKHDRDFIQNLDPTYELYISYIICELLDCFHTLSNGN